MKELITIQNELKAPKSLYNSFGKFAYRSAENILTAVKPLLLEHGCQLTLSDDVVAVGNRIYIKAIATIINQDGETVTTTAFAAESDSKKGMDSSQLSGCASSYARKYALNGLFLIDDTKDADTDEYHRQTEEEPPRPEKGNTKIGVKEQENLRILCEKAGDALSLEKALIACHRERIEDITYTQYYALVARLTKVA